MEEEKEQKQKKGQNKKAPLILVGLLGIIIIVAIIVILLLQGKTTTSGTNSDNIKNDSLICTGEGVEYAKLKVGEGVPKELEFNMIFRADKLSTISMTYTLRYGTEREVVGAEAVYHADMNHAYAAVGYGADEFNTKYARYEDRLILTQYASGSKIDEKAAPFFMIDLDEEYKIKPKTLEDYKKNYEGKGLKCKESE